MVIQHPVVPLGHEGLEDRRADFGVIVGAQEITNIVEQGADHIFLVPTVAKGAAGGLQRMLQPIH